jgi:hypothetical protein
MTAQLSDPATNERPRLPDINTTPGALPSPCHMPDEIRCWPDLSVLEAIQLLSDYDRLIDGSETSTLFTHVPEWFAQLLSTGRATCTAAADNADRLMTS